MNTFKSGLAMALACLASGTGWTAEPVEQHMPPPDVARKLEAARQRLDSAAREIADLTVTRDAGTRIDIADRAVLGINIGSGGDAKQGVEIASVSPGGPAEAAGMRAGDVIVEIEGKALKSDEDGTARSKLLSAMRKVEPDEKVVLKYQRDGKTSTVTVTPRRMDRAFAFRTGPGPGVHVNPFSAAPRVTFMRALGVFGNAELVALTPKLGQYFGTDKGLLVVRAPDDSRLKLEEGDVILDIDGRVPNSPSHAMRILSSYQSGEKLKLNVLRMKKKTAFEVTIPEEDKFVVPQAGMFPPPEIQPFELPVPAPD